MDDLHQGLHQDNIQHDTTYLNPQLQQQQTNVFPYHIRNCLYLTERLFQMKNEQLFSDLVFEIQDHRIHAHRCVIASWSPYLYNHLNVSLACMEIVRVHYDHFEIFSDMISFMYTGKIDLRDTNLIQLLHLATSFQIDTLREVCEETLRCNLHEGNIVSTFYVARKFKLESLEEYSMSYLQMHLPEAVKQSDFLNLSAIRFNTFLSTGWMVELKPEVKLFLIISWLGYDVKEREQYLVPLLQHIDWSTVAGDFLLEISQTENFFTTNESSLFLLLQTLHSSEIDLGSYTGIFPTLRKKYSHLLTKVVENSVLKAKPEQYYPVSISVTIALVQANEQLTPQTIQIADTSTVSVEPQQQNNNNVISEQVVEALNPSHIIPRRTRSSRKNAKGCTNAKSTTSQLMDEDETNTDDADLQTHNQTDTTATCNESNSKDDDIDEDQYYEDYVDDDVQDPDFVTEETELIESVEKKIHTNKSKYTQSPTKTGQKKGKKTYQCMECEYSTVSEARYEDHRKKSHSTDKTFTCHICDFTCSWGKKFNQHMTTHYYGPPYQCEHEGCKYSSDTIRNILVHRVRHTDERPYPCDQCDMRFRTRSNLCAHRKCHQGEKPWKCPVCEMSFATKSTLNQHSVRHSDDRPYLCDKCGFGTKFQSHLIAHKRIHTGDVFRCQFPQCSYFAPKQSQLKGHMRTHLGIRKYSCEECDKSFIEKSHLVRHKKIHLDEKPFSCTECGYSSTRKDKLKEHIEKKHEKSESKEDKADKKKKKKGKKGVKKEPRTEMVVAPEPQETPVSVANPIIEQQPVHQPPQDVQIYQQMVPNTQYLTPMEPVMMDPQNPQNMVIHAQNGAGLITDGQMLTPALGHHQYQTVGTAIDHQQVTVVMDARVHAQLNSRGLVVDPQSCMNTGIPGTLQAIGQHNPGDPNILYTVPTTSQTVVMATPQQDYTNIGSYYSFVMNNEGQ